MPSPNESHREVCGTSWKRVAGEGTHFLSNDDPKQTLLWAIGGDTTPATTDFGYRLPAANGYRDGSVAIMVPAGKGLWIRSGKPDTPEQDHAITLTYASAP